MATAVSRPAITHIVFDMGGLLLDTEIYYAIVQEKILARFGKAFDWSLKKPKMMGKKAIQSAHIFVEENGLHGQLTPKVFLEEREGMLQDLFPRLRAHARSVVMVSDRNLDVYYHKDADQVLTSLLDFNPSEWDLPLFDDADQVLTSVHFSHLRLFPHFFEIVTGHLLLLKLLKSVNLSMCQK